MTSWKKRIIIKEVKNQFIHTKTLDSENKLGIHRSTVSHFLTAADYVLKNTPKKIILTKEQKIKRLDFAKKIFLLILKISFLAMKKRLLHKA